MRGIASALSRKASSLRRSSISSFELVVLQQRVVSQIQDMVALMIGQMLSSRCSRLSISCRNPSLFTIRWIAPMPPELSARASAIS